MKYSANTKKNYSPNRKMDMRVSYTGFDSHGGAIEKLNNEERLNVLTDGNLSKIEINSVYKKGEKSIDLESYQRMAMKSNPNFVTEKVMNSNKLSKYLTNFIGKKDYRTTEEREYAKCTFNPKFYPKHRRYKTIKARLTNYIQGEQSENTFRDAHLFTSSENVKGIIQTNPSAIRGGS